MPPSIPASATAELPAASELRGRAPEAARGLLAGVLRKPGGAIGVALTTVIVVAAVIAPYLAPSNPFVIVGPSLAPPSATHPMGTDALGRDLLSGVLYGARGSLLMAAGAGGLALLLGLGFGAVAGFFGGRTDDLLMRTTEFFQVLPRFFLALIAIALFGPGPDRIVIALGVTAWPSLARVVRAEVLTHREREYVLAAVAIGASRRRILLRELLPNAAPAALVVVGLLVGQVLLIEASLGFLGLGDPDTISWGSLAGQASPYLRVAWWLPLFPGVAIALAVLGVNLVGDALADALGGH